MSWLIVGLGNPGPSYARHRHNVGFMLLDALQAHFSLPPFRQARHYALTEGSISPDVPKVRLMKPLNFMNLSGPPVAELVRFYKIPLDHVLVVHDDLDLAPGKIRVKKGGGSGGHNGLKSLDSCLTPGYHRLRMGIGHPGHRDMVHDYVLGNFVNADHLWLQGLFDRVRVYLPLLLTGDAEAFVTKVMQPPA